MQLSHEVQRLHAIRLYAKRPIVCISLTAVHKRVRLVWCKQHMLWIRIQWNILHFTDEFRFSLDTHS
ncbi:hypothetical protein X975_00581, partial [Stegodyphus mimosarum]